MPSELLELPRARIDEHALGRAIHLGLLVRHGAGAIYACRLESSCRWFPKFDCTTTRSVLSIELIPTVRQADSRTCRGLVVWQIEESRIRAYFVPSIGLWP